MLQMFVVCFKTLLEGRLGNPVQGHSLVSRSHQWACATGTEVPGSAPPKGTEVPAEHCRWTAFSGNEAGVFSKIHSVSLEESNWQYLLLMKKCQLK